MSECVHVLRAELAVLRPGGDRLAYAPLLLERTRQILAGDGIQRMLAHLALRLRDGRAGTAAPSEGVANQLAEVETAGADPEEDEPAPEDEDEEHERPLRLIAQAGEEHRVLRYALGAATGLAAGWASMARLALCAAAVSSCQSIPPLS